tara:strand:- start:1122 stop:1292 length:171 start_codon:yes stop_codon:yes gene_type:complete
MSNTEDSLIIIKHFLETMSEEIEIKDHTNKEDLNELVFTLRDLTKEINQHLDELEG